MAITCKMLDEAQYRFSPPALGPAAPLHRRAAATAEFRQCALDAQRLRPHAPAPVAAPVRNPGPGGPRRFDDHRSADSTSAPSRVLTLASRRAHCTKFKALALLNTENIMTPRKRLDETLTAWAAADPLKDAVAATILCLADAAAKSPACSPPARSPATSARCCSAAKPARSKKPSTCRPRRFSPPACALPAVAAIASEEAEHAIPPRSCRAAAGRARPAGRLLQYRDRAVGRLDFLDPAARHAPRRSHTLNSCAPARPSSPPATCSTAPTPPWC